VLFNRCGRFGFAFDDDEELLLDDDEELLLDDDEELLLDDDEELLLDKVMMFDKMSWSSFDTVFFVD